MIQWIALILSLPTENSTVRMRTWRALKASGAAVLRDGVYVLPERASSRAFFETLEAEVVAAGGTALVIGLEPPEAAEFERRFDRSADYQALSDQAMQATTHLLASNAVETQKLVRKLRKGFTQLCEIDFFPGEAQRQTDSVLVDLELGCARALSPDEPVAVKGLVPPLQLNQFQNRIWVTRERPWVDRLASAWLIRRFIDPNGEIRWMKQPQDRSSDALGFDFDGAEFSHIEHRVTFEVLMASFGLKDPALMRFAAVVHYLDVGGLQPPEAAGLEMVLTGLQAQFSDDDALLEATSLVLDGLLAGWGQSGGAA